MFSQLPLAVRSSSQNAAGCKPMSQEKAILVRRQRRARYNRQTLITTLLGWRPKDAWACQQETAATAGTFTSLIGVQPATFWQKIWPQVGVGKNIACHNFIHYVILLFRRVSTGGQHRNWAEWSCSSSTGTLGKPCPLALRVSPSITSSIPLIRSGYGRLCDDFGMD